MEKQLASLRLVTQGRLLVAFLIGCEIIIVAFFLILLEESEIRSQEYERAKEIVASGSRLLGALYRAGDRVGKYAVHKQVRDLQAYESARAEARALLRSLDENLQAKSGHSDNARQRELLGNIQENVNLGFDVLEGMKQSAGTRDVSQAVRFSGEQRLRLQPYLEELIADMKSFMSTAREMERELPEARQANRARTWILIYVAGVLNIVVAVVVVFLYVKSISGRIKTLTENARRFEHGDSLLDPLIGQDEIAILDKSFREARYLLLTEEELQQSSESAMLSLIDQMPVGLLLCSFDGKIQYANFTGEKMLGFLEKGGDLEKLYFGGVLPKLKDKSLDELALEMHDSNKTSLETDALKTDGSSLIVDVSIVALVDDPVSKDSPAFDNFANNQEGSPQIMEPCRFLILIMDASERHEMQKLRDAFVAMVSHELRTPLTAVYGYLELLEMGVYGPVSDRAEQELSVAISRTVHLTNLVNDLLDMEKIDAGKFELELSESTLAEILAQAIDETAATMAGAVPDREDVVIGNGNQQENCSSNSQRQIRSIAVGGVTLSIVCQSSEAVAQKIIADKERLATAISRIIACAISLSPVGSAIVVRSSHIEDEHLIEIEITGLSIPASEQIAFFDRFQNLDSPLKKGGIGLSAALSRGIIELHGGRVDLSCRLSTDDVLSNSVSSFFSIYLLGGAKSAN